MIALVFSLMLQTTAHAATDSSLWGKMETQGAQTVKGKIVHVDDMQLVPVVKIESREKGLMVVREIAICDEIPSATEYERALYFQRQSAKLSEFQARKSEVSLSVRGPWQPCVIELQAP